MPTLFYFQFNFPSTTAGLLIVVDINYMLVGYNTRIIYDLFKDVACCVCEPMAQTIDCYSNKSMLLLEIADLLQLGVKFMLSK
jgi:hypothetical protein